MSPELTISSPLRPQPELQSRSCIHELFEDQVANAPDAVAVTFGSKNLTYAELNARANQLAHRLRKMGVGPEVKVALYLDRCMEMVVAILGVLKAGGAYVPVDLAYPKERLSFMIEDAQPPILLTQDHLRDALSATAPEVLRLDSDWGKIATESTENPENRTTGDNLAYVIYTSGSTGKPKGVQVTHHNVVRLLKQTEHWYGFNESDVWPLFHSYAFDVSVWELWGCFFYGGRLVVVPYLVTRSPGEFYDLLASEKVTVLNQTPSAFRQLIWAEESAPRKHDLNLRYVICAGEALELQSLKPWFDRHGDEKPRIVNKYGITETTVHSTYRVIRKEDLACGVGSVIGVPIPDLQIYLVDDDLKPVPPGSPGEICVGGAGVARGYLNRPELTSRRFLPDPFSDVPGARLYRSGDLAQINSHGELEYLGRMDHQVKIRGFRVELGEIESALNRHGAIRESVVMAPATAAGDRRLVAYIVPVQNAPTVTELREYLSPKIPDYMIPGAFVFLKALPLTTNGKVDRRALPAPDGARPELKSSYLAPRNETEARLVDIWKDELELNEVGVDDNFFELGGDSIRSIRVLSRAQQEGIHFTLQDIFQHPTVAGLTACAREARPAPHCPPSAPFDLISAEDKVRLAPDLEDAYPLTRLQLGMFYYNELDRVSAMYHDVFSYRVQSAFDAEKLQTALQRLAQRHPLLRTSYHLAGFSEPLQLVHKTVKVPFSMEDLRHLRPEEQERQLVSWVEEEKRRPFDRTVAPLFRFHAQWRGEKIFQLIISFHHCGLDGWSLAAVITEILQDYAALLAGGEANIAPPQVSYRDFVALERQAVASEETRRFWAGKLEGATAQRLPRWPKAMCEGGPEQKRGPEVAIPDQSLAALRALAQAAGVPLKTVLLAAHQHVMGTLYGQNDVLSGLICNGRPEQLDGEKLVGLFLNTCPLRLQLGGGTWHELVQQIFAAEQELVPHRRFPLAEANKLSGGQPLFESAFDFVHFHVYKHLQGLRDLDLAEGHYFEANNLTTYTTFMLDVSSSKLELHIDYDPNVICSQQIEQITCYYIATLNAMAADPGARYEQFSPLSPEEKQRQLVEYNATREESPRSQRLEELFEARVRETPDSVALTSEGESLRQKAELQASSHRNAELHSADDGLMPGSSRKQLTYRELNDRAQSIAEHLRRLGVGPEALVGLHVERCAEMVIALLGILKTRAAYVPLDPTYPQERLAFMLQDSKAPVVITQRKLLSILPKTEAHVLCIEEILETPQSEVRSPKSEVGGPKSLSGHLNSALRAAHSPDSLAYVIYTSGSTGRPKGVQVVDSAVVNVLTSIGQKTGFSAKDKLLAVTTLSFDIAGLELFLPLISGAEVIIASRETAGDGTRLAALINSSGATAMQGTPATWRLLLEAGWRGKPDLRIFCGGEALNPTLARELLTRGKEVWNFYGPTETTIWSSAWKVAPDAPISIGRPLANTQFYILDKELRLVPAGTAGELHIGGGGLARGYLNRPELTKEKFITNPFAPEGASRLYKTGDLARYLPDGQVECLGRLDSQIKVRGFRIEPGEVETALRQHHGIADALVTAKDDAIGEKRLVGYIISKNGPPATVELRDFLKCRLPLYMVPAQFVTLREFPLTPNGKVDLRQLPAPEASVLGEKRTVLPPRTADEQGLAEIWKEVLSLNEVGIDDNFFDLGGDSLSATRAFARINRSFGMDLTLREILERPTIGSLAELVGRTKGTAAAPLPRITRQPRLATV